MPTQKIFIDNQVVTPILLPRGHYLSPMRVK